MRSHLAKTLVLVAVALVSGCAKQPSDAPPQIRYGQEECAHCGMIISDERHAAALRVEADGRQRDLVFDDIGDMLAYERENGSLHVTRRYVHDFETRKWLDAAGAYYLQSEQFHTPMGSGIIAFADEARGRAQEKEHKGKLARLNDLKSMTASSTAETRPERLGSQVAELVATPG